MAIWKSGWEVCTPVCTPQLRVPTSSKSTSQRLLHSLLTRPDESDRDHINPRLGRHTERALLETRQTAV